MSKAEFTFYACKDVFFKKNFVLKYIKIWYFFLKKLFLILVHQNNLKKIKKIIFLQKQFPTVKTNKVKDNKA
jgi:hypothetical protein